MYVGRKKVISVKILWPQLLASPQIVNYSSKKGLLGEVSNLSIVTCI